MYVPLEACYHEFSTSGYPDPLVPLFDRDIMMPSASSPSYIRVSGPSDVDQS